MQLLMFTLLIFTTGFSVMRHISFYFDEGDTKEQYNRYIVEASERMCESFDPKTRNSCTNELRECLSRVDIEFVLDNCSDLNKCVISSDV